MRSVIRKRPGHKQKKRRTSDIFLEKLDSILERLGRIESDLREIKSVVFSKRELEEKESAPEFFMQK